MLFTFIILVGQTLFMIGGYTKNYWFMILGRVIFGLGGECLGVSISTITTQWFKGKELNFALQLGMSAPQIGVFINGYLTPYIYNESGLGNALLIGTISCAIALLASILLAYMDKIAEKTTERSSVTISDEQ